MKISEEEKKAMEGFKERLEKFLTDDTKKITFYRPALEEMKIILNLIEKLQKENEKYKQFFDLMLRLDSDCFMNCGDEGTIKLVNEIEKLESEE